MPPEPRRRRSLRIHRRTDSLPWRWRVNAVRRSSVRVVGFAVTTPWLIAKAVLR